MAALPPLNRRARRIGGAALLIVGGAIAVRAGIAARDHRDAPAPLPSVAAGYEADDHFPGAAQLLLDAPVRRGETGTAPLPALPANATVGDVGDASIQPARPFVLRGSQLDRARALQCLTTAIYYEAGNEPDAGQRAVAQVVLNRVRHPAFPASICGVVFQGSERRTGCQFTFTCDGALTRRYPDAFWERARQVAAAALSGSVYAPVGYATHYHTDWVVPYWQSSLSKIAAVDTHLFFRWAGWWGTPGAFRQVAGGEEPRIVQLTPYSDVHKLPEVLAVEQEAGLLTGRFAGGSAPRPSSDDPDTFLVALDGAGPPDQWPALAAAACGDRVRCKFFGWRDRAAVPAQAASASEPAAVEAMSFGYFRDRTQPLERRLWNCQQVPRPAAECMRRAAPPPPPAAAPAILRPDPIQPAAPLTGVRRRSDPVPTASPVATRE